MSRYHARSIRGTTQINAVFKAGSLIEAVRAVYPVYGFNRTFKIQMEDSFPPSTAMITVDGYEEFEVAVLAG